MLEFTPEKIREHTEAVMKMLHTRYDGRCAVTIALRFESDEGSATILASNDDRLDIVAMSVDKLAQQRGDSAEQDEDEDKPLH